LTKIENKAQISQYRKDISTGIYRFLPPDIYLLPVEQVVWVEIQRNRIKLCRQQIRVSLPAKFGDGR